MTLTNKPIQLNPFSVRNAIKYSFNKPLECRRAGGGSGRSGPGAPSGCLNVDIDGWGCGGRMEDILSTLSLGRKLLGMKFWMMELEVAPLDWYLLLVLGGA